MDSLTLQHMHEGLGVQRTGLHTDRSCGPGTCQGRGDASVPPTVESRTPVTLEQRPMALEGTWGSWPVTSMAPTASRGPAAAPGAELSPIRGAPSEGGGICSCSGQHGP